jgi:phage host-nuclease inhibitor protein Gam
MTTEAPNFIDELLADVEKQETQQTAAYYDLLILEIAKLEEEIAHNFTESDKEVAIIKEWALKKNAALNERSQLLRMKLEDYIRNEGKKTMDLPHGTLKIRKSPDKIEITDMQIFLKNARAEMLSIVPEQVKPDLNKIKAFMKVSNKIPDGISVVEGKEEFKLTLRSQTKEE